MARVRWIVGVALVAVVGAGALVACSGDHATRFNTVGNKIDAGGAASGSSATAADADRPLVTAPKGPDVGAQLEERQVVYTGSITVKVSDATKAAERARNDAEAAGGYLAKQRADLEGDHQVVVSLRVPADAFDETMAKLAKLGTVRARRMDSDDVTDQVVDLQERLANAKTSATRLRELLAKAENINNVIAIEDRLTQRETEIEQLTGQLEVVQDQVALSTISATFTEQEAPAVSKDLPGPVAAARAGGVAFVNVVLAVVAALAFLLPFLLVAMLVVLVVRRRRGRRRHGDGEATPAGA